jgi:hypothetical protein
VVSNGHSAVIFTDEERNKIAAAWFERLCALRKPEVTSSYFKQILRIKEVIS